jgi:hypothetical protein
MAEKTSTWTTRGRAAGQSALIRKLLTAARNLLLILVRKPDFGQRRDLFITALVLRLASVGLLAWIGYIHWVLWQAPPGGQGYKFIPTDGPFFLVDAIAGVVLAIALLVWQRALVGLLSAGFTASTILALVISLAVGLFGFNESISANYVVLALVWESIALVIVLAWTVLAARAIPRRS